MREYPILHLDTKVKEQLVVRKDMDVSLKEHILNPSLTLINRYMCPKFDNQ
jgi:hypothetical protein